MKESYRLELKLTLTDSLEKEVVAFLNSREGGVIYIGIADNGVAQGVENSDAIQLQIKDRLKNNIHPTCMGLFDIIGEEISNKEVIKIIVASGPEKPYYLKKQGMSEKGCFIRIGTAAEPMPGRMIENLFARRTRNSIGKIRSNQQKLKFEQLKIYYEESGKLLNSRFAANLGLQTEDGTFNYVAFLMSDINSMSIKVAKYRGKTRVHLIENNEYGYCSIIKATKQVLDKIELENKTKSRITSRERIDTRLWNAIALREAIINAMVHNDYSNEVPPKFEIFDDRIEITSAGSLPDLLSQEEFFEGFSIPRNQEMMRIFKDLELVEHLGSGIPRILEAYPKECFRFTENFLRMTFPNSWDLSEDEVEAPDEYPEVEQTGGPIGGPIGDPIGGTIGGTIGGIIGGTIDITERQKEIIEIIAEDNKVSVTKLSNQLKINRSAAQEHIEVLKKKGLLTRIGGTRGYWQVVGLNKEGVK
jgi:predicted HTH transcriptional regulator